MGKEGEAYFSAIVNSTVRLSFVHGYIPGIGGGVQINRCCHEAVSERFSRAPQFSLGKPSLSGGACVLQHLPQPVIVSPARSEER